MRDCERHLSKAHLHHRPTVKSNFTSTRRSQFSNISRSLVEKKVFVLRDYGSVSSCLCSAEWQQSALSTWAVDSSTSLGSDARAHVHALHYLFAFCGKGVRVVSCDRAAAQKYTSHCSKSPPKQHRSINIYTFIWFLIPLYGSLFFYSFFFFFFFFKRDK